MSRRRYISTDISLDGDLNKLAMVYGDFAALFYSWMIPHAEDDGTLSGTPEELLFKVAPGRRDKTPDDIAQTLRVMHPALIWWDEQNHTIYFPPKSFYKYQTYIPAPKRRTWHPPNLPAEQQRKTPNISEEQREMPTNADEQRASAQNSEEQRGTAQNAASPSLSLSPSPTEITTSLAATAQSEPAGEPTPEEAVVNAVMEWWCRKLGITAPGKANALKIQEHVHAAVVAGLNADDITAVYERDWSWWWTKKGSGTMRPHMFGDSLQREIDKRLAVMAPPAAAPPTRKLPKSFTPEEVAELNRQWDEPP